MRSSAAAAALVLILMFLPLFYVLSLGPAVWLHDRGMMGLAATDALETFYYPLQWASERSPAVSQPLEWYVGLWDRSAPVPVNAPLPPVPPPPPPMPMTAVPMPAIQVPSTAEPALSEPAVCR